MLSFYFTTDNITYFIPELAPGEEQLWDIYYKHRKDSKLDVSNVRNSFWARQIHRRLMPASKRKLFARIAEIEGKGSKMAYLIHNDHPTEPITIMGFDAETGQLFEAKYAETEMQRITLNNEFATIDRLTPTGVVPELIQYEATIDASFMKVAMHEGERLYEDEMNEDIINHLVTLTQYSMFQFREENSRGLITCLSNGSFAPWNTVRDSKGQYHMLHWHHATDRPLGYDLIYYLAKPYIENGDADFSQKIKSQAQWVEHFFSMFGIEDYSPYINAAGYIYAAQLESEGRYVEANKVRLLNRMALSHFYKRRGIQESDQMHRPKVMFIMHMPPPIHGASMVGKWIHESDTINSQFDSYYLNLTAASSMADIGKFSLGKATHFFRLLYTIRSLVKKINPELIYITPNAGGMPFIKDSIVVNMLKKMGCNVLAHFHNKGVSKYEKNPIFDRMYRKFFDHLKVLLIVPSLYDDKKTYLRIRDLYVCPNGTPLTVEKEVSAERHHEVPEILFLSNMIISKGVLDLLDALYLLRGQNYHFHCTMIGAETPELSRNKIQYEINSRHLQGFVDYIGPRYGSEKDEHLAKTDIFAFPTYYPKECFPLVILEAMEYKIPVVSTNEAGIPYSVIDGQTGLLCKSQNPISLSEKLIQLLDNPELRWQMGEAGYKLRKEKFCLENFEQNLANVLERTIDDIKNTEE